MAKFNKYKPKNKVKPVKIKQPHNYYKEQKEGVKTPKRGYEKRGVGEKEIINMIRKEINKAKSRIRTLERNGLTNTPFCKKFMGAYQNKEFSVAGKSLHQLIEIHAHLKALNAMKTATKKGAKEWKEYSEKIKEEFNPKKYPWVTQEKIQGIYDTFIELNPTYLNVISPIHILTAIKEVVIENKDASLNEIIPEVEKRLDELYERMQAGGAPELKGGFKM